MGRKAVPLCGFGQTILFHNCKEYVDYLAVMRNFPRMTTLQEITYKKSRRDSRKHLYQNISYHGKDKEGFLKHFDVTNWERLDQTEKERHTYYECKECPTQHDSHYAKLRRNTAACEYVQSTSNCGPVMLQEAKETIVKKTVATIAEVSLEQTNRAVLTNDLSFRAYQNVRRCIVLDKVTTPKQQSTINPEKYQFDREAVAAEIVEITHGDSFVNWAQLARTHAVYQSDGRRAQHGNQILKEFAICEGLINRHSKVNERRGKRKLEVDSVSFTIADMYPTDQRIKQLTQDRISSGELDIGRPIVPITLECLRIGMNGDLQPYSIETQGRAYKLQNILDKLLLEHEGKGYLRKLYAETADITTVKKELESKGIYVCAETIEELNDQILKRMFAIWHDHSTVGSHSHFLVLASLIYDPLVYLTPEEYRQIDTTSKRGDADHLISDIERPEVYIFARSQSSTKDQMLYTPYRLEDFESLIPSISAEGHIYKSVMRAGIGDSPSRAFESGNQVNGHFACHCGLDFRCILSHRSLTRPKFTSWKDRDAKVNCTDRWRNRIPGQLSVYDKLDVKTLRSECTDRGIDVEGCVKKTLEDNLTHDLRGIKRPIALLCTEEGRPSGLVQYMICQLEILHDLKSIIGNIVKEMVYVVPPEVKQKLAQALPLMQNHQHEISGSNARLTLLRLRQFISRERRTDVDLDTVEMRRLDHLLTCLSHIQQLSYSTERNRDAKTILAMHNLTFMFSIYYMKLFLQPRSVKMRAMYGMPFHSILSHFAEWFRIVALRSLAAENQERFFKMIKRTTQSTNYRDDHLIVNSLIRLQSKAIDGQIGSSWKTQESSISVEWANMPPREPTIIPAHIITEHPTLFAAHKHRIIDYVNDGLWHVEEEEGSWVFRDGDRDGIPEGTKIKPMHIRTHSIEDVWNMLDNGLQEYKARRLEEVDAVPDLEEEVPVINFGDDDVEDDEIFSMGLAATIDTNATDSVLSTSQSEMLTDGAASTSQTEMLTDGAASTSQTEMLTDGAALTETQNDVSNMPSAIEDVSGRSMNLATSDSLSQAMDEPDATVVLNQDVQVQGDVFGNITTVGLIDSSITPRSSVNKHRKRDDIGTPRVTSTPALARGKNKGVLSYEDTVLRSQIGIKLADEFIIARRLFKSSPLSQMLQAAYRRIRNKVKPIILLAKEKLLSKICEEEKLNMLQSGFTKALNDDIRSERLRMLQKQAKALEQYLYY